MWKHQPITPYLPAGMSSWFDIQETEEKAPVLGLPKLPDQLSLKRPWDTGLVLGFCGRERSLDFL